MNNYKNIINNFQRAKILVVGDIILDRYVQGFASRLSPEAPVPVVVEQQSFYRPGGSANVAHNLTVLHAHVTQVGKIGNDFEGQLLKRELIKKGVDVSGVFIDKNFPTITKTRILAQHQQIVRIDKEKVGGPTDKTVDQKIFNFIEKNIGHFDAIILSDYGKGMITSDLLNFVIPLAVKRKKVITVDPKVEHFNFYRKVTAITPNIKEAENAIRNIKITSNASHRLGIHVDKLNDDRLVDLAGEQLLKFLDLESLLITLGERGMRLFEKGKKPFSIQTKAKQVFDVTGAGDTVISVFTLSLTAGASHRQAATLANLAAGIVVGKLGAETVSKVELLEAIKGH